MQRVIQIGSLWRKSCSALALQRRGGVFMRLFGWMTRGVLPRIGSCRGLGWAETFRHQFMAGTVPTRPFLVLVMLFYTAAVVYGSVLGGHADPLINRFSNFHQAAMSAAGLTFRELEIVDDSGQSLQNRWSEAVATLGLELGSSIFDLDIVAASQRLSGLSWVDKSSVYRFFPDRIRVVVKERNPFAIWQHNGNLSIIDPTGRVIFRTIGEEHRDLILFVGEGANFLASGFMKELELYPELKSHVRAVIRIANRRWNIQLKGGGIIKLPENDFSLALSEVVRLGNVWEFLGQGLVFVDMRLPDRITFRLSPEASLHRRAVLEGRVFKQDVWGGKGDT